MKFIHKINVESESTSWSTLSFISSNWFYGMHVSRTWKSSSLWSDCWINSWSWSWYWSNS